MDSLENTLKKEGIQIEVIEAGPAGLIKEIKINELEEHIKKFNQVDDYHIRIKGIISYEIFLEENYEYKLTEKKSEIFIECVKDNEESSIVVYSEEEARPHIQELTYLLRRLIPSSSFNYR